MKMSKYYRDINEQFIKYTGMSSLTKKEISERSDLLPAYMHDTGNYVSRYGMGNFQIQAVLKFDGRIDFDRLSRAVRLTLDAEPVLGSRFVEHDPPYWKRRKDIDTIKYCSMEKTGNVEGAIHKFLESHLDMDNDLMVKVKLIRSEQYDTLGIKINHTCSDGAGTKQYIHLLADLYSRIGSENLDFTQRPSDRSRRDHKRILKTLGIKFPLLDNSMVDSPRTVWAFPWWKAGGHKDITPMVICRLPDGQLDVLSQYGKARGATINDLILAAFYRAMFKTSQPLYGVPMDIGLTVDLRRYLPDNKADAIRNLTGGVVLRLARLPGEPFEGTLSRVVSVMSCKKDSNPGHESASGAERMEMMMNFHQMLALSKFMSVVSEITSQNCVTLSPGLSNMGLISKDLMRFGENTVTDAYILPPAVRAPGFLLVASSYNGILTLAAGYYKGAINRQHIEKLLNRIRDELMEGCK